MSAIFICGPICQDHLVKRYTNCWMGFALLKSLKQMKWLCGGGEMFVLIMKIGLGQQPM
jgi:hypothetical protein